MKKLLSLTILFSVFLVYGCKTHGKEADLKWYDNLDSAIQVAKKENRPILMNFTGSDWCVWCKKLNAEVFSKDDFVNYAKNNLVLVKIDFPEKTFQAPQVAYYNKQLAQRFGVQGYPTIVLLDSKGYIKATTGYVQGGADNYIQHLKNLLM